MRKTILFSYKQIGFILASLGILSVSLIPMVQVTAAEFANESELTITESQSNLYAAGNEVVIKAPINRDLVVAGGVVRLQNSVERNLIAAGNEVYLEDQTVGASARIAAGQVELSGVIEEDLIIFAGQSRLANLEVRGDLVVMGGGLDIDGLSVEGDFYGSLGETTGDSLEDSVVGAVNLEDNTRDQAAFEFNQEEAQNAVGLFALLYGFHGQIAVLIATLILISFLGRRGRLAIPSLTFDSGFAYDFLTGIGIYLGVPVVLAFSFLFGLIPVIGGAGMITAVLPASGILFLFSVLSSLFFPTYLGNLFRNTFGWNSIKPAWAIIGAFVVIALLEWLMLIPILNILIGMVVWIFTTANFGYLVRRIWTSINWYLSSRTESDA